MVTRIRSRPGFGRGCDRQRRSLLCRQLIGCPATLTRNPDSSFRASNAAVATFTRLSLPELNGNVLDIRVGGHHTLVLTRDRKLYAFGCSQAGQLGDSRFTPRGAASGFTPEPVLTNVVSFAAGLAHSVAVKDDGTVWTWGRNGETFALCDGTTVDRRVPTQLPPLAGRVVQVAANVGSTILRTTEGALYACGGDSYGQLGLAAATESTKWTPIPRPTQVQCRLPRVPLSSWVNGTRQSVPTDAGSTLRESEGTGASAGPPSRHLPGLRLARACRSVLHGRRRPCLTSAAGALHRVPSLPRAWTVGYQRPRRVRKTRSSSRSARRCSPWSASIKANRTFTVATPEGVRMEIADHHWRRRQRQLDHLPAAPLEARIEANAYPHQLNAGALLYWTPTGCDIVRTSRTVPRLYESPLGELHVNLNPRLDARNTGAPSSSESWPGFQCFGT